MAAYHNKPRYKANQLGAFLLVVTLGALSLTAWVSFIAFVRSVL